MIKKSNVRLLIALAAELDLNVYQFDVCTAFLNGDLDEEIFMVQPDSFVKKGNEMKVCKLNKAIYGLKQASRQWNVKVTQVISSWDISAPSMILVFFSKRRNNLVTFVALYVDDFVIFTNHDQEKDFLRNELQARFKIKDFGKASQVLGMKIRRKDGKILVDQQGYIEHVVRKFGLDEANEPSTPMEHNLKFKNCEKKADVPFQELMGCLMYLAVTTRPDIAYVCSAMVESIQCLSWY